MPGAPILISPNPKTAFLLKSLKEKLAEEIIEMLTAKDGPPYPQIQVISPRERKKMACFKDIAAFTVGNISWKQDGKGQSVGKGEGCHDVTMSQFHNFTISQHHRWIAMHVGFGYGSI
ncbi:hypothetical protein AJ78_03226 [Emergomyces pasteurianus Ep9510]|uniref:Uncharacterized protein n=1 Tax=Emergomyces pasteurianus Ep9510 TaxID=1447872 RepID=A0A1J9PL85_9EURO|nr:hypothetical protein AJ78_03226 [Emergomyces pasteurianus Ep9510]